MSLNLFTRYGLSGGAPIAPSGEPEVSASVTGGTGIVTSLDVGIPAGSGGLLLIVLRLTRGSGSAGVNTPSGWTKATDGGTFIGELAALWRIADGTEGSTVTVTLDNAAFTAWVAYRISGAASIGTPVEGLVTAYNVHTPPELTPSWGSASVLWIAVQSTRRGTNEYTSAPANYEGLLTGWSGGTGSNDALVATAHRVLTAVSEIPGAFGFTGTASGAYSATLAVRAA